MTKKLFSEFRDISSKEWKQKIQVDLKGADYNDTLVWHTNEGIDVSPFYHADQFDNFISVPSPADWKIGQFIRVLDAKEANAKALDCIKRGAEAISFLIATDGISMATLLQNIDTDCTSIHILAEDVNNFLSDKNITIQYDIIGHLARSGNWYTTFKDDHKQLEQLFSHTNQLTVDTTLYQNAGATMVQQLSYALAHVNEYLNHFDSSDKLNNKETLQVVFKVAVGTNYFLEIAKLRALRLLWSTLASEYGITTDCYIVAQPSKRNKTLYDYNTNMLRTTTECMSAVLGGADEVYNLPYDAVYHKPNEFGDRIARNQLLILKHESYFDKVSNPSDGAYYIESLTEQLATKALEIFKSIEAGGGFLQQLKAGVIQKKIKASATKEQEQFNTKELVLLGTNKHPNAEDRMKHDLELHPFLEKKSRKTLLEPILEKRLSEGLEQERLDHE